MARSSEPSNYFFLFSFHPFCAHVFLSLSVCAVTSELQQYIQPKLYKKPGSLRFFLQQERYRNHVHIYSGQKSHQSLNDTNTINVYRAYVYKDYHFSFQRKKMKNTITLLIPCTRDAASSSSTSLLL